MLAGELAPLRLLGIETVGQLETSIADNLERIERYAERWLEGHRHTVEVEAKVHLTVTLLYLGYLCLGRSANKDLATEYLYLAHIVASEDEDTSQRILDVYELAFPND